MFYMVTILNVRIQFWILSYKVYSMLMTGIIIILNWEFIAGIQVCWIRIGIYCWNSSSLNMHKQLHCLCQIIYIWQLDFVGKMTAREFEVLALDGSNFPQWATDIKVSVDPWTVLVFDSTWYKWSTYTWNSEVWSLIYYKESYSPRLEVWVHVGDGPTELVGLLEANVWTAKDNSLLWGFLWVEPVARPGFQIRGCIQPCCS